MLSPSSQPPVCEQCGHPLAADDVTGGCLHCLLGEFAENDGAASLRDVLQPSSTHAGARFHHYELLRGDDGLPLELGRGAMGVTYKAVDVNLHVPVALKVIDANYARHPRARELFLREARSAARLRHPNVATVYHFGTLDSTAAGPGTLLDEDPAGAAYFYAMEFVDGETLDARVQREGALPAGEVLEIAVQIARAMAAAEERGIVHRDLKPANVMLAGPRAGQGRRRESAWVKVIDFGLARALCDVATGRTGLDFSAGTAVTHGAFVGTPGYASPEQFELAKLDVRSDMYSLGATLWFALTGRLPYEGDSLAEIHDRQTHRALPLAQLADVGVPAPLVKLLTAMLAPDPAGRPASAQALGEALETCLADAPRRGRRWRVPVALGILGLAAVSMLAAFHPWKHLSAGVPAPTVAPGPAEAEKSVAVLPFENLSTDQDNAFFAQGIQNDLIASLGHLADLKVIGRTSVASYQADHVGQRTDLRTVARALGVTYLLEGSVQRSGDRVRINARLIDARSETSLWSKHYDRDLADIFAIQDELADQITAELRVRLSPTERASLQEARTSDLAAYDLDLRARQLLDAFDDTYQSREMVPAAIRLLDEAVARDSSYLRAWCDLVRAHMALYWYGFDTSPARLNLARTALDAAARLAPDAGETHLAQVEYHYRGFRDYDRARNELALARQSMPNDPTIPYLSAVVDRRQGRWDESERGFLRALELDPRDTNLHHQLATNYRCQRRYADAARTLDAALLVTPGAATLRNFRARLTLDADGNPAPLEAADLAVLHEDASRAGEVAYGLLESALCQRDAMAANHALSLIPAAGLPAYGVSLPRAWFDGLVAHTFGDEPRAQAAFLTARAEAAQVVQRQPESAMARGVLGMIEAGLGHREEAIRAGKQAVEMLPVSRDAIEGPELLINLALVYTKVGEPERALDQLEAAAEVPSLLSYGLLKLHPRWDPLRGNARFERLLAKLAPAGRG